MVAVIGPQGMTAWFEHHKTRPVPEDHRGARASEENDDDEDAFQCPTLLEAHEMYDGGLSFRGEFLVGDMSDRESYAKRALQLLSQICMSNIQLLASFVDIFIAAQCSDRVAAGAAEEPMEVDSAADAKDASNSTAVRWSLREAIKSELSNIVPAMCQHSSVDSILSVMMTNTDTACKPLLCHVLRVVYSDFTAPIPPNVINKVKDYIKKCEEASSIVCPSSEPNDLTSNPVQSPPGHGIRDLEHLRLLLPLVGGFSATEMQDSLPRLLSLCSDDAEELKGVFIRITKARPPVMTKASLLVCLHR